jgi:hypothetical protein
MSLYGRITELSLRMEHQHDDGSWGTFERAPHDVADHDPEREWVKGQFFKCTACDELIRISSPDEAPAPGAEDVD